MASAFPDSPLSNGASNLDTPAQLRRETSSPQNLLENVYGIEKRTEPPRKKLKTEKGEAEALGETKASNNFRGKSGGIIGDYMKPAADAEIKPIDISTLVDLTNDDDDDEDLQVVSSRSIQDQEVCYGHIMVGVQAHLVPKPAKKEKAAMFEVQGQWPVVKCTLQRQPEKSKNTIIDVFDPYGMSFGRVMQEVAVCLAPAMDGFSGLRTNCRLLNRTKKPGDWPHQPTSEHLKLLVNIFGRKGDTEKIGKLFGQHNLWFRTPLGIDKDIPVVNPHQGKKTVQARAVAAARYNPVATSQTAEEASQAVSKLFDELASKVDDMSQVEGPDAITTDLLRHQKQALFFMLNHEKPRSYGEDAPVSSLWRRKVYKFNTIYEDPISGLELQKEPDQVYGGLLADVMGLGKTIEALSLIASTTDMANEFGAEKIVRKEEGEAGLLAHTKATLIVCPTSTVQNWESQIKEHMDSAKVTFYIYHGPNRTQSAYELAKYDIVITTYGTLTSDMKGRGNRGPTGPLRQLRWFRVMLDEAHTIREQRAQQSQAVFNLWAQRRWALTGTPIQNRIEDLGALTRFLQIYPYDSAATFNRYIRAPVTSGDADFLFKLRIFVDSFTLRRTQDVLEKALPAKNESVTKVAFSTAEDRMHSVFKERSNYQVEQYANVKKRSGMQNKVLQGILTLRLICAHGRDLLKERDLEILKGAVKDEPIELDNEQLPRITKREAYESYHLQAEADVDMCRECGKSLSGESPSSEGDESSGVHCYMLPCYDTFCSDCFKKHRAVFDENGEDEAMQCPFCDLVIAAQYVAVEGSIAEVLEAGDVPEKEKKVPGRKGKDTYTGPHSKTKMLLTDIMQMKQDSDKLIAQGEKPVKCVIFSEFTSHLDLIGRALTDNGFDFVRIDGSMSLPKRKKVLNALASDDDTTILLASIKAAGQGLNLTAASRAFIMEPMWNPAAEAQAVDRIYRIGQEREVKIIRYIMEDSIEEQIVILQKKKQKLADVSLSKDHKTLSKKEAREHHMKEILALFK